MEKSNGLKQKTEIKYKITSCYYCSDFLDNENIDVKSHIAECGQVLQECPFGCVAYIRRKDINTHKMECQQKRTNYKLMNETNVTYESHNLPNDKTDTELQATLNEEICKRHELVADIAEIRREIQQLDIWLECVESSQKELQEAFGEETRTQADNIVRLEKRVDDLGIQYKEVKHWRKEFRNLLDEFHRDLEFRNDVTLNLEILYSKLGVIENDTKRIQENSLSIQSDYTDYQSKSGSMKCDRCVLLERKVSETLVELRQMKNIVCESEDKCDRLEKIVVDTRKECARTKQELTDLNVHLAMEKKMRSTTNNKGHLIWCIDQYVAKMKDAKENDVVLRSPIFSNQQYGYNLRLNIFLDGFGTWKGRNILACIDVVSGEYDTLLRWPCKLMADIKLRDQSPMAKDITKSLMVRKRDATYESNQYIFIAHKAVQSRNFLRNDMLFFEVIIHSP